MPLESDDVTMKDTKFVITLWKDEFDYDGLTSEFSVLGEFRDSLKAHGQLKSIAARLMIEQLNAHTEWHVMAMGAKKCPAYDRVNKNNNVLDCASFKIGDGTGYNSSYSYVELIEVPRNSKVDENLFNLEDCGFEVRRFFDSLRTK